MKETPILILGPMPPVVLDGITAALTAHRLWEMPDRDGWLHAHGAQIRGVASSGSSGAVDATLFQHLPKLEIISHFGVGYDNVDVAEALRRHVIVTHTPDVLTEEVADLTLGLLIATVREIPQADRHVRSGQWRERMFPLTATLRGRRVGMLGLGRIGQAIARRCEAFGLTVAYHTRTRRTDVPYAYHDSAVELARHTDVLIAITPGGASTRHLVNAEVLRALGPDGVLINVARGSVVDEDALIQALRDKTILAAGLDVFENEPDIRSEFLALDNVVLLPHVASASVHTRRAMGQLVVDNLVSWFSGKGALKPVPECAAAAHAKPLA